MAECGGQTAMSCQMCEQSSPIKKKCLDCDYLLCANCCQLHKKIKALLDHQLVDLQDIGSIKEGVAKINFKNIDCRSHAGHKCCLFCEDCDEAVCAVCISEKHNQHKMIQLIDGHKLYMSRFEKWCIDTNKETKSLAADISTLDEKIAAENFKYFTEKEKILDRDKVLKEEVDTQTKTLVSDLDQRWYRINKSVKDEISNANKYKQHLQSRQEQFKQALESSDADDVFKTVQEVQKQRRSDQNRTVNLKFETLPTFITKKIDTPIIHSQHGVLLDSTKKDDIKIHVVECYKTDSVLPTSIQCNEDGTIWINYYCEKMLKCLEKCENRTLTTAKKLEVCVYNMALTPQGDLLLSVGKSHLLMIPYKQQTITKSQYSVSPLVTTYAIHASSNKIIVGARDQGPLYPANGPRQIIVMDPQGKNRKVHQYDSQERPLFTNPRKVTTNSTDNLYVLDRQYDTKIKYAGRLISINNQTGKIKVYSGHSKVNQNHPFTPGDLAATKSDNIVVSDMENHVLHILNSDGDFVKYINTEEHGIKRPWSVHVDKTDLLYIGCDKRGTIKEGFGLSVKAKLHVVKFTGF